MEELRVRTDVNSTFKTRQCKQYAENMICSYGSRCQFIHTPMTVEKQREVSYARMLHDNEGYVEARINCMGNWHPENSEYLTYISAYER